ncbi:MAG: hypothetical protein EOO45_05565 [Flavobacterium sp.]|nr:MAG: hypothetical protein EOO45_05565 [Flavobacterium sp.]
MTKTYKADNKMAIIVSDNGIGVAESELKKNFQKYQYVPSLAEGPELAYTW